MLYGIDPPENSPEYDEWLDAQEEKKALQKQIEELQEQYDILEEDFPAGHEPDDEPEYNDNVWEEGDR